LKHEIAMNKTKLSFAEGDPKEKEKMKKEKKKRTH